MHALAATALSALLPLATVETTGSLGGRLQLTAPAADALTSTRDTPVISTLTEGNLQARLRLLDDTLFVLADASALVPAEGLYFDGDPLERVDDHDTGSAPRVHLSELYVRARLAEHLDLSVGKRRVTWGTGLTFVPTDVLNPPRDPTDPSLQRTGVPLVLLDALFEGLTISALFAPDVLAESGGLPSALFSWPDELPYETAQDPAHHPDPRDDEAHFAAALRGYALVGDADLNLWLLVSHRYGDDAREYDPRLAASFSRVFLEIHELHAEVLLQQGSDRLSADPRCVDASPDGPPMALGRCGAVGLAPISQAKLHETTLYPRALVGTRSMFADESQLIVELLWEADGLSRAELDDLFTLQRRLGTLQRAGLAPMPAATEDGGPARLSGRLQRRLHLSANWQRPRIADDFTLQLGAILALEDLSALTNASLSWQTTDWLTLSAWLFVPTPSLARVLDAAGVADGHLALAPVDVDGTPYGAFDATPFDLRALFEARAFF